MYIPDIFHHFFLYCYYCYYFLSKNNLNLKINDHVKLMLKSH